jgi:hypothetical protein
MTVDDRTRLQLHRRLEEVLGADEADTLMAHLPPVTWQDVATKQDLAVLDARITALGAELRSELAGVRSELYKGLTRQTWSTVGLIAAFNAALATVIALTG